MNTIKLNEVNINKIFLPTIDLNFKQEIDYSKFPENLIANSIINANSRFEIKPIKNKIIQTSPPKFTFTLWTKDDISALSYISLYLLIASNYTHAHWYYKEDFKNTNPIIIQDIYEFDNAGSYTKDTIMMSLSNAINIDRVKLELGWNDNPIWSPALEEM